jgi:hypothetical protein
MSLYNSNTFSSNPGVCSSSSCAQRPAPVAARRAPCRACSTSSAVHARRPSIRTHLDTRISIRSAAAPLGSTVSIDDAELPPGLVLPKLAHKEGKVLHPDLVSSPLFSSQAGVLVSRTCQDC